MADVNSVALTDEEREELEALRAEKARREEEERMAAERAELEALRAEQERVDAQILAERAAAAAADEPTVDPAEAESAAVAEHTAAERTVTVTAPAAPRPAASPKEPAAPAEKTFGQRMVTSDDVDADGIPTMPMAQKIILAVALVAVVAFLIYTFTR